MSALFARIAVAMLLCACAKAPALEVTEPDRQEAAIALRDTAAWLLEEHDGRDGVLPNGARRAVNLSQAFEGADIVTDYTAFGISNTAACKSLEFLAEYAQEGAGVAIEADGHSERHRARVGVRRLYALIQGLRSADPSKFHYGAISGGNPHVYAAMPNAICGRALLTAGAVMGESAWRDRAIEIARFLLRLQNPAPHYPEIDWSGVSTTDGIYDHVYPTGVIETNQSSWSLAAAPFLNAIYAETGVIGYRYGAIKIARGMAGGALQGADYYAVGGLPVHPKLRRTKSYAYYTQAYADGRWHCQGEPAPSKYGTVTCGTDGAEYGMAALLDYGHNPASLAAGYMALRDAPSENGADLDMGVSFSGYFRRCVAVCASGTYNYGSYYDVVGAGLLAKLKRDLAPLDPSIAEDARSTFGVLRMGRALGTMTDAELRPIWSRGWPRTRTDGTLPTAANGLGLLAMLRD